MSELHLKRYRVLTLVAIVVAVMTLLAGAVALADMESATPGVTLEAKVQPASYGSHMASTLRVSETFTIFLPLVMREYAGVRSWPDTTSKIAVFNDQIDTRYLTEAQFQFAATHYVGSQKLLRDATRHLRQYNPNFLVLHYRLGQALGHSEPSVTCQPTTNYHSIINGDEWVQEWPGDANVQENWFFHYGSRVFHCDWGHYLAELDDPRWREWWSTEIISQLQNNENDGLFADSYSVPNYIGGYAPALPPVNVAFESAWATREYSFTDYIRAQFAGRWKWIPNVGMYITTRDPSDYSNVDGLMIEGFV